MKRNIQEIPLDLIKLDQENVRFGNDVAQSQREALELMMSDPEDGRKILRLAEHIAEHGLDPTELQLVFPDGEGAYIVLEGNRRLTALKLLQKPDACPTERLVSGFFAAHNKIQGEFPSAVDCSVVASRADGDMWIELKHTGQNNGIGRVNWDSDIRDERRARQTGVESVGRQIRALIKNNPKFFSASAVSRVSSIHVTTLTRLFSSTPARSKFYLNLEGNKLSTVYPIEFTAPAIEYAINLFLEMDYNVNDVRSDDDRKRFVSLIPDEFDAKALFEQSLGKGTEPNGAPGHQQGDGGARGEEDGESGTGAGGTAGKGSGGSGATGTRAKPSSKSRKYLLPWSLTISNSRINEIYRELRRKLLVDTCPNATAVTFRVFLEVCCDDFIRRSGGKVLRDDNKRPVQIGDKLSIKIKAVARHLEAEKILGKESSRGICKRAGATDTVGSTDHLNMFVHSSASPPIASELKDIAEEYWPLFEAIWSD